MRYAVHLIILCVGLIALDGHAEVASPEEKAFIDRNMGKLINLDPTAVTGEALEKVFGATFYVVKVSVGAGGGTTTLVAARVGDNLADVSLPSATADFPALK